MPSSLPLPLLHTPAAFPVRLQCGIVAARMGDANPNPRSWLHATCLTRPLLPPCSVPRADLPGFLPDTSHAPTPAACARRLAPPCVAQLTPAQTTICP